MQQHPAFTQQSSKPFLKWAGGKQRLLSQLLGRLPQANRLIEPFVGAGSLFLSGRYPRAILNDANADLMALWTFIQERPAQFCADASGLFCEENRNKRAYECIRQKLNSEVDRYERCVRLLYLNRFGFNGLYRVNKAGSMNTPYGYPSSLPAFPWEQIALAHEKLRDVLIFGGDFQFAMSMAGAGDLVYCDPPYLPMTSAAFKYTPAGFSLAEHERLVQAARQAVERGATVAISNHDTPEARALYRGFEVHELPSARHIAAKVCARRSARELLAILHPAKSSA